MIEINEQDIESWESRSEGEIYIAREKYHRNAELFLSNFPNLKNDIVNAFNGTVDGLDYNVSTNKGKFFKRIKADSLNKGIKNRLGHIDDLKFEVEYKEGILMDSPATGGFDFALFDERQNVANFRNYCFGRRSIPNGQVEWEKEISSRGDWAEIAEAYDLPREDSLGENILFPKQKPTIIGEVQFGNWGLLHYDMLKVLHLDNFTDLDLLIYVTAADSMNEYISSGTVNYLRTEEIIDKYSSILKVPIWLIGLDIR
ncbi:hypothetical protein ACJA3J_14930 [Halobacillus sp. SY10]|uniref:hypothetical protein n=1 Tax=Halobacillus sp. SY10 TaxID=3381356 RepID=UPI003879A988